MPAIKRRPTTIYLDPKILQAVKIRAALSGESVSDIANQALASRLKEDEADLRVFRDRAGQPTRDYESVLRDLKKDGLV
jgi:hypothetical protein